MKKRLTIDSIVISLLRVMYITLPSTLNSVKHDILCSIEHNNHAESKRKGRDEVPCTVTVREQAVCSAVTRLFLRNTEPRYRLRKKVEKEEEKQGRERGRETE